MGGVCREVVTLQLGHYSNFVGTHWWNLQDASLSYDPDLVVPPSELQSDVLFREGLTLGGQITYTPRLIAMDLKGSLQTLRQEGILYDTRKERKSSAWKTEHSGDGEMVTYKECPPTKNSFLQDLDKLDEGEILAEADFNMSQLPQCPGGNKLSQRSVAMETVNSSLDRVRKGYQMEGSVRVWSDFLRIHLHPRTITVINQYNHDGESQRLEAFGQGEALLQGSLLEELEDKLHFFVEECDYLQGFQVLCDLADGFSGLGSKVTEMLRDSYGSRGILTWGVAPVGYPDSNLIKDVYHMMNYVLGTASLANHSSFFCPLTLRGGLGRRPLPPIVFPHLQYDPTLWYHSSAILALALDSLTVPYRLRYNSAPMWQVADSLAACGRKVVAAYGAVPFPMMQGSCLPDALHSYRDALPWRPLSACRELSDRCSFGQWVTLRGLEGQKLVSTLTPGTQPPSPLHSARCGEEVVASYVSSYYPASPLAVQLVSSPSKLTSPFPQLFHQTLSPKGFLQSETTSSPSVVASVPVLSSLQSSPALGPWLAALQQGACALDLRRVAPSFLSQGPEHVEMQETLEQLINLAHCYHHDNSGTSSDDDDDD
ncbi:protein misato homolog 1-like isoform X1 [Paramormyrops kingsleyae]|uniref:protein misato homolog 1-like isoform X1 n=1 Tax=Paramormyrops kingsleyae TaxID=1676925 RepID=UPI003B96C493